MTTSTCEARLTEAAKCARDRALTHEDTARDRIGDLSRVHKAILEAKLPEQIIEAMGIKPDPFGQELRGRQCLLGQLHRSSFSPITVSARIAFEQSSLI